MDVNGSTNHHVVDELEVDRRISEAFVDAGFTTIDEDGNESPDYEQMKSCVFELVKGRIVPDRHSKSENSWTQGELYAKTFPTAPSSDGTDPDLLDATDREVRTKLLRKVWNLTNPGVQGFIQKRLGAEGSQILCRGPVMRGLDEVMGVYVTDDIDVIMSDSIDPQVESLVRKANSLRKHVEMVGGRHPELQARIAGALGVGIDRTRAALPSPVGQNDGAGGGKRQRPDAS